MDKKVSQVYKREIIFQNMCTENGNKLLKLYYLKNAILLFKNFILGLQTPIQT